MKKVKEENNEIILSLEFDHKGKRYRYTDNKIECKKDSRNKYSSLFTIAIPQNSKYDTDYNVLLTVCKLCVESYLQGISDGKTEKVKEIKSVLNLK